MNIIVSPGKLSGNIKCVADKSELIRIIIAASLSDGVSRINGFDICDDVNSAIECCLVLGARFEQKNDRLTVFGTGVSFAEKIREYPCGQSGAVLRFLLPVVCALRGGGDFVCEGQLAGRPLQPYITALTEQGILIKKEDNRISVRGWLKTGAYEIPGNVSSQFFSGLCFALPICGGGTVRSIEKLQSSGYVDMTLDVLKSAGIGCQRDGNMITVPAGEYRPISKFVEPSWSQAAFFVVSNYLGSDIALLSMKENSLQPDSKISQLCRILKNSGDVVIDISQTPDLFPPLALCACIREGNCTITNAGRLKYKESNRLETVSQALISLGAKIEMLDDGLLIRGVSALHGGEVECNNDHRIAMLGAAASTVCSGEIILKGAECVSKSYPGFFDDFRSLGGVLCELG